LRHRLPDTRLSTTHKFSVGGCECYIIVGLYETRKPGEIFFRAGNSLHDKFPGMEAALEMWCIAISMLMQEGHWPTLYRKFAHQRFEPSGFVSDPEVKNAKSIVDYIIRWIDKEFFHEMEQERIQQPGPESRTEKETERKKEQESRDASPEETQET